MSYDARDRLTSAESADRRITYDYDPTDRLVGRTAYQKTSASEWTLETRTNVLARDGLPAAATFVWDPLVDRLIAVYDSTVVSTATAPNVETGLLRQYLHGDEAYDDPLEVLIAAAPGSAPTRYLPIIDEAGSGSLQAVTNADGTLIERVLYADAYGDAPRYLHGAVVERIATRTNGNSREITITFSEPVDAATIATGLRLTALAADGTTLRTHTTAPSPDDARTLTWTVSDWPAFTTNAARVAIAVTRDLRFPAWGTATLQPTAEWEHLLGRATASAEYQFLKTAAVAEFTGTAVLYDLPDLYLAARPESRSRLLFDFHALPLRDPATQLVYVRARWYDASTGSFLTADPMGYADASNLYAYAGNDPINALDPSGEIAEGIWDAASLGLGLSQISQWNEKTSLKTKAVDVFGVFVDTVALVTPFVPGGAGAAMKAYRAGANTEEALNLGRRIDRALEYTQSVDQAANALQGAVGVQEDLRNGEAGLGTVLKAGQTALGIRSIRNRGVVGYQIKRVDVPRGAAVHYGGAVQRGQETKRRQGDRCRSAVRTQSCRYVWRSSVVRTAEIPNIPRWRACFWCCGQCCFSRRSGCVDRGEVRR